MRWRGHGADQRQDHRFSPSTKAQVNWRLRLLKMNRRAYPYERRNHCRRHLARHEGWPHRTTLRATLVLLLGVPHHMRPGPGFRAALQALFAGAIRGRIKLAVGQLKRKGTAAAIQSFAWDQETSLRTAKVQQPRKREILRSQGLRLQPAGARRKMARADAVDVPRARLFAG